MLSGTVAAIVRDVSARLLDAAVYNEQRLLRLLETDQTIRDQVVPVGRVGHSMGGRNLSLLAPAPAGGAA
jgi:predicted alpha/beta hydrolase